MVNDYLEMMADEFSRVKDGFERELTTVRTGRASPVLLEKVQCEVAAYGSRMPINQLATISAPEPRLLVVNPWDKSTIGDIEKGIVAAGLGLNPSNDGQVVHVPIPALTAERRQTMVRGVRQKLEDARIRARGVRKEFNDNFKGLEADKEISEDELKRLLERVQSATNDCSKDLEAVAKAKEQEILED